jgi:hypothetical protein
MSTGLRTTFWVHAIVALVVGIVMVVIPNWVAGILRFTDANPLLIQGQGVLVLTLGVSSLLAAIAQRYEQVKIVVEMEIFYTAAAIIGALYALLFAAAPVTFWGLIIVWAIFLVAFGYFALQERRQPHAAATPPPAFR